MRLPLAGVWVALAAAFLGSIMLAAPAWAAECSTGPSDEFDGAELNKSRWSAIVRENPDTLSVAGGKLTITTEPGDIYEEDTDPPPNNIILQPPTGPGWTIQTKLSATITDGYSQGGLIAYGSGNSYVKLNAIADVGEGRINRIELRSEFVGTVLSPQPNADVPAGVTDIWLRLTNAGDTYTGEYSFDGANWTEMGQTVTNPVIGMPVGVFAFGVEESGDEVSFDYFRVDGLVDCTCVEPTDEFNGVALDKERWNAIVREDASLYEVRDGELWIETSPGDFYESDDPTETRNFILQSAENAGEDWTIETKVLGANLPGGYAQGGLIAYVDDENYVKIDLISPGRHSRPYRIEVRSEIGGLSSAPQPQVEPLPEGTEDAWLRLTKRGTRYTTSYSLDGESWTTFAPLVGNPMDDPAFGIFALGVDEPGTEVGFEYFDFEGEANCGPDATAPETDAGLDPAVPGAGGTYDGPVEVMLSAADLGPAQAAPSGVAYTEYRVTTNGTVGDWIRVNNEADEDPFLTPVTVDEPGNHVVQFRSADNAGNVEETRPLPFRIAGVEPCLSDSFSGGALHPKWSFTHPTSEEPTVAGGALVYSLGFGDLDKGAVGPIAFTGQPIPDGDFEAVAKFTADIAGDVTSEAGAGNGHAQAGLLLYQSDESFVRITHTRAGIHDTESYGQTYYEVGVERDGSLKRSNKLHPSFTNPGTWWLRVARVGDELTAWYALSDPEDGGEWQPIPVIGGLSIDATMPPANGPVYVGPYGGNGSTQVSVEYFRVAPDGDCAGAAPGQPQLKFNVKPRSKTVPKRKRQISYRVNLRNRGEADASSVRVCVKAKKKRLKVKGKACRKANVPAGARRAERFRLRIKPAARGKRTAIKFVVRGAGLKKQTKKVNLRVGR